MKYAILFSFLLIACTLSSQQSSISGVVSIHNSQYEIGKRQYVEGASVEGEFTKTNSKVTDANGTFNLIFIGILEKTSASILLKKEGLQVVNLDALTVVTGQRETVRLSMAKPEKIEEYRRQIYNIGKTEAEKNLAAQLKKKGAAIEVLQKDAQKNAAFIAQLQKEYAELERYAKNIEEVAKDLARHYAPINLDDAAPLYREAFGAFQKGDFEKALQILRGADLIGQADKILAERETIETIRKETDSRDSVQEQRTKDLLQVLGLKADLHKSQLEWDSTRFYLELRVALDSTNVNNLREFAYFLQNQNETQKAIAYYEKALVLSKSDELIGMFCNNLGNSYYALNQMPEAEKYYLKSLDIRERLSKSNPQQFAPNLAATTMNLGAYYATANKMPEAEKYYLKSLDIYERLSKSNPQQFEPDLARIAMNLGVYYATVNKISEIPKIPEAEKYYLKSLDIYERLSKSNPQQFEPYLATTAMNLGSYYYNTHKMPEAEKYYLQSLDIRERLSKSNPQQFEPYLARTAMNLGNYYSNNNNMPKARNYYLQSLDIYDRLPKSNTQQFEPDLGVTLYNFGLFYQDQQNYPQAENYMLRALAIYEKLAKITPSVFDGKRKIMWRDVKALYEKMLAAASNAQDKAAIEQKLKVLLARE